VTSAGCRARQCIRDGRPPVGSREDKPDQIAHELGNLDQDQLQGWASAITTRRRSPLSPRLSPAGGTPAPRDGRNGITARCACPDSLTIRIRAGDAARLLGERSLRCERCGDRFTPAP
jgi:hypothetical protein